jgi:uracil-DNA glycosylase family 4
MLVRDPDCTLCRMGPGKPADTCLPGVGPTDRPKLAMVSRTPLSGKRRAELDLMLDEVGIDPAEVFHTSANRCKNWEVEPNKADVKTCRTWLYPELAEVDPQVTVAMGNEALLSLTGHSGIMKYRGKEMPGGDAGTNRTLATISPAMVARNPGLRDGLLADLAQARRMAEGTDAPTPRPAKVLTATTMQGLQELRGALAVCDGYAFDVETTGYDELRADARILTIAFTLWYKGDTGPREVWAVPLAHPESPWLRKWTKVLKYLAKAARKAKRVVAHNGKFDMRWCMRFGLPLKLTFDTLLAAHLLDENRPKALEALCQVLLGVPNWKIDNRRLIEVPLKRVLVYNALDTWYDAHLYFVLREQIREQPRLARLLQRMLVPASNLLAPTEQRGIWCDREALHTNHHIAQERLDAIDQELLRFVPAPEDWPTNVKEVNFNPSNFLRWWLFEALGFPILARGKNKDDGSPGNPSVAEATMLRLQARYPDHRVLQLLTERTKWQKYTTAFFGAYEELIDDNDRIHTTFKLTGTVTGRLSSGKADTDKVTGRVQNRGVNLQQVPRDGFVRGIFGAEPGWLFVEIDYSQIELRIAAHIAQERTMLAMYQAGEDIHTAMAMRMTGKPRDRVTKEERKMAKAVNFGFLYGMGALKFIETAWSNYGLVVTLDEARLFRRAFFEQFPGLQPWHAKQRRLAHKYKRVESPLGRVRHLPDIDSPVDTVQRDAERQAINSPVQAMASDMTLLSLVQLGGKLRHFAARSVGTVHDALNMEMPVQEVATVVPYVRHVMENLPLERDFGVRLTVPVQADVKVGTRWGSALEVPADISQSSGSLHDWLGQHRQLLGLAA